MNLTTKQIAQALEFGVAMLVVIVIFPSGLTLFLTTTILLIAGDLNIILLYIPAILNIYIATLGIRHLNGERILTFGEKQKTDEKRKATAIQHIQNTLFLFLLGAIGVSFNLLILFLQLTTQT